MKFNLLPVLFSALPLLLLELATPANAAALCIPGIYCPVESTPVPSAPECSGTAGSGATGVLASSLSLPTPTLDPTESYSTTSDDTPSSSDSSAGTSTADPIAKSPSGSPSLSYSLGGTTTADPIAKSPSGSPSPSYSGGTTTADPIAKSPSGSAPGGGSSTVYDHGATTTITVTATSGGPTSTGTTCSTGPVQCCNSVEPASSANASNLLSLLGIVVQGANVPIGLTCSPLTVLGLGSGAKCNAQTVCCENNSYNGLINIGCTPINLGL